RWRRKISAKAGHLGGSKICRALWILFKTDGCGSQNDRDCRDQQSRGQLLIANPDRDPVEKNSVAEDGEWKKDERLAEIAAERLFTVQRAGSWARQEHCD